MVRFVLRKFTLARELLIKACLSFLLSRAARDKWGSQERTVSMSSRDEPATNSRAISRIAVSGFKSIQKKQEIELRPLTILAGANSSGKSTMMQSLLLLKQTLEAPYDPGPLLINGPIVEFSETRQMFSLSSGSRKNQKMEFELGIGKDQIRLSYSGQKKPGHGPIEFVSQVAKDNGREMTLSPDLKSEIVIEQLARGSSPKPWLESPAKKRGVVVRNRCFLEARVDFMEGNSITGGMTSSPGRDFIASLEEIIHVPGLRGNPQRSYPVGAVGKTFPGTFNNYVASSVVRWAEESHSVLKQLGDDLAHLGLTWKVQARLVDDSRVELRVGRLLGAAQGGANDLVNIADVGFGVS